MIKDIYNRNVDSLILFPPAFYPHMPYLATASLVGCLRQTGLTCEQKDLNIDFFNYILTNEYLSDSYRRLQEKVLPRFHNDMPEELLLTTHPGMSFVIRNIEQAKEAIRNGSCYFDNIDPQKILDLGLAIISDSYYPLKLTLSSLKMSYNEQTSTDVWDAIHDEKQNIFIDYFNRVVPSLINDMRPNAVAISVTAPTQIIATFTLCKLLRKTSPQIQIILGGNIITRLQDFFSKDNILSQFYDYCIVGEGEEKLGTLIHKLKDRKADTISDNLITNIVNKVKPLDLNSVKTPDFGGLPITEYFSKETILPVYSSRRCYWDKCKFCDIPFGYDLTHRSRSISNVVADIEHLHQKYAVQNFKFVDEALPPHTMRKLSVALLERELDIRWEAFAILENNFSDFEFCKSIYDSGCRWLYFGFETGSKNLSAKMTKRHSSSKVEDILRTTSAAGIKNHLWIIIGFPGQTQEDIDETVRFVERNCHIIHSIEINQFTLSKHAPLMKENLCESVGIMPIIKPEEDMALTYDYETTGNFISQSEARSVVISLRKELSGRYGFSNAVRSSNLLSNHKPEEAYQMEVS